MTQPASTLSRIRIDSIPLELKALPQWVTWRYELRKDRWTKVPYQPREEKRAESDNAATWGTFEEALAAAARHQHDGIGFMFSKIDPYVGIDLDDCIGEDSQVVPEAQEVLALLDSYAEVSPSERGVKVWIRGGLPAAGTGRRAKPKGFGQIEVYQRGRFFTVTGWAIGDVSAIPDRERQLLELWARYFRKGAQMLPAEETSADEDDHSHGDEELIERAKRARNGEKFAKLWSGDWSGYSSQSEADLALCSMLAFYTGDDADRIDRLFRRSGLMREKWEREDYRRSTIARAVAGRRSSDAEGTREKEALPTVLVPGLQIGPQTKWEVGTNDFTRGVLGYLPPGTLYRMDFVVGHIVGAPGEARFVRLDDQMLRQVIDEHVRLATWTEMKNGARVLSFRACRRDWASLVMAAAGVSGSVRSLRLLTHHPVYTPGFSLAEPGWNANGGVYYDPPPDLVAVRPDASDASGILQDLLFDFPFKDKASFENTIGLMLTIALRPAIRGPVPFHLFTASLPRTGKGKCINASAGTVLGRSIAPLQVGVTEEEREKRITSLIIAGETVAHLDNLPAGEALDSASLASLATAYPELRGRVLGVSKAPALPNNLVVALSGNNAKATDELAKRMVPVVLQPRTDHPEARTDFVHPCIEEYALERRPTVLAAVLGMVESWKAAGMPPPAAGRGIGGFEAWGHAVGGVLRHAGFADWLGNYRDWVRSADEWTADAETLVDAWERTYGDKEVASADILRIVQKLGIFPVVLAKKPDGRPISLARRVLGPLCNRPVAARIVARSSAGSNSTYRLMRLGVEGDLGDPGVDTARTRAGARESGGGRRTPGTPGVPDDGGYEEEERAAIDEHDGRRRAAGGPAR